MTYSGSVWRNVTTYPACRGTERRRSARSCRGRRPTRSARARCPRAAAPARPTRLTRRRSIRTAASWRLAGRLRTRSSRTGSASWPGTSPDATYAAVPSLAERELVDQRRRRRRVDGLRHRSIGLVPVPRHGGQVDARRSRRTRCRRSTRCRPTPTGRAVAVQVERCDPRHAEAGELAAARRRSSSRA